MPGHPGGIQRGNPIQEDPPDILEASYNGGKSGGILLDCFQGITRGDTGRSAFPKHL